MNAPRRLRPLLIVLAALWAAGCARHEPDNRPAGDSPTLNMDGAVPRRPPADVPPPPAAGPAAEPQPQAPARELPPRPPMPIPNVDPAAGHDGLPDAFIAAKQNVADSRAQAQLRPLLSVPLKQLLGPAGRGVHLLTGLKIKAADGAEYGLSAQSSRLGVEPVTGYVVIYRNGMRAPVLVDLRSLKLSGPAGFFAGGTVDEVDVEGRKFGVALNPSMSDANCRNKPMSEIQLWPKGDEAHTVKFTVSAAFAAAGAAAAGRFKAGQADVGAVAYQDFSGGSSIAFLVSEPLGGLRQISVELLARADGKLVSFAVPNVPQRLGARVTGAGADRVLDVFDLAKADKSLGDVPLESLAKLGCQ